jgi:hypothetical protein
MTKTRTPISAEIVADVMFASDSTCCKCNERGKSVQVHHIDEDPSHNDPANLAVLCLQCHDETQVTGGFGRKLNAPLVIKYRDTWVARVAQRRAEADRIAVARVASHRSDDNPIDDVASDSIEITGLEELEAHADAVLAYITTLPERKKELKARVQDKLLGSTADAAEGTHDYISLLQGLLVTLARFYSAGTFGDDPHRFFADSIANAFRWHRAISSPHGPGTGGTIVGRWVGEGVMSDVEDMVVDIAMSLIGYDDRFDHAKWHEAWKAA